MDGMLALLHVEPSSVPPIQRRVQRYNKVLASHPIVELQINTTDYLGTTTTLLLQLEQMTEEVEVRRTPRYASQKWIKIDMCNMVFGWRLHKLTLQNSNRSLKKG